MKDDVIPLTVSVVVVEDGHAGLGVSVQLGLLPVVWLRHPQAPGGGPVVETPGGVGRGHRHLVSNTVKDRCYKNSIVYLVG